MKSVLILLLVVLVVSCGNKSPKQSVYELTGDKTQRIAGVTKILSAKAALPSAIQDAFFLEEQTGDGVFGPSDFSSFCAATVAVEDLDKWKVVLTPIQTPPEYSMPRKKHDWWILEQEFGSLEFFRLMPFSTREIGWIGISTNSGKIYFHTETM